jgi:hypothetical protein
MEVTQILDAKIFLSLVSSFLAGGGEEEEMEKRTGRDNRQGGGVKGVLDGGWKEREGGRGGQGK